MNFFVMNIVIWCDFYICSTSQFVIARFQVHYSHNCQRLLQYAVCLKDTYVAQQYLCNPVIHIQSIYSIHFNNSRGITCSICQSINISSCSTKLPKLKVLVGQPLCPRQHLCFPLLVMSCQGCILACDPAPKTKPHFVAWLLKSCQVLTTQVGFSGSRY